MTLDFVTLKAAVPLEAIVAETHEIDRFGKTLCPAHSDARPSCHIYDDHFHCFSCGSHGDALDWLMTVHNLTFAEALTELERHAGSCIPASLPKVGTPPKCTAPSFKPVPAETLIAHRLRAARLERAPAALEGRGFALDDLHDLGIAAYGDDAVLPVNSPQGRVLALKRRHKVSRPCRYSYLTSGCGSPAWCSPKFLERKEVLVIEGELNGAACWLARPEIAVQGIAGANGMPHLDVLRGRVVFVYGDNDEPGQKARDRWAAQALEAGAQKVYRLEPWEMDACDIAGKQGRNALLELLT